MDAALAIVATLRVAAGVAAEDFPAKPIRLFVGLSAGSATDSLAHPGTEFPGANAGISKIHVPHRPASVAQNADAIRRDSRSID